jgi:hypothetical protein
LTNKGWPADVYLVPAGNTSNIKSRKYGEYREKVKFSSNKGKGEMNCFNVSCRERLKGRGGGENSW